MSKKENQAYGIVNFLCNPASSIELGMVSEQLLQILKLFTRGDKNLRELCHEYIDYFIEDEDTTVDEYKNNSSLCKKDYDIIFFEK